MVGDGRMTGHGCWKAARGSAELEGGCSADIIGGDDKESDVFSMIFWVGLVFVTSEGEDEGDVEHEDEGKKGKSFAVAVVILTNGTHVDGGGWNPVGVVMPVLTKTL
jgi:hypothetical protein